VTFNGTDQQSSYQTDGYNFFSTYPSVWSHPYLKILAGEDDWNTRGKTSRATCSIYVDGKLKMTHTTTGRAPNVTCELS
jgi:hypothetical protein